MTSLLTTQEWQSELGQRVRRLRLRQNADQRTVAECAGVALTAMKNLESGKGATLKTLIKVLCALERVEWLETLGPMVTVDPLHMVKYKRGRRRASPRGKGNKHRPV